MIVYYDLFLYISILIIIISFYIATIHRGAWTLSDSPAGQRSYHQRRSTLTRCDVLQPATQEHNSPKTYPPPLVYHPRASMTSYRVRC